MATQSSAPPSSNASAPLDTEKVSSSELLELTLEQLLSPEFVQRQTRGLNLEAVSFASTTAATGAAADAKKDKDETELSRSTSAASSAESKASSGDASGGGGSGGRSKLVSTVLQESRVEFLTAGFSVKSSSAAAATAGSPAAASQDESEASETMARLSRELAAQALSGDCFPLLVGRRAALLSSLHGALAEAHRKQRSTRPRKPKWARSPNQLVAAGIHSGVHIVLKTLRDAAFHNPTLCFEIFSHLKSLLETVPALAFSRGVKQKDGTRVLSELSADALDKIHSCLFEIASASPSSAVVPEVRSRCLELLLGLAVARGSLSYFLTVLRLLLFPVTPIERLSVLPLLHKLQNMRRVVHMEEPSAENLESKMSVSDVASPLSAISNPTISIATDGVYLYCHSRAGLIKIGIGRSGSTPGMVYVHIPGYRSYEQSSLACWGDKLFFRSTGIAPAAAIVLSTETLTEIGKVHADGTGTYPSVNNSHFDFAVTDTRELPSKKKKKHRDHSVASADSVSESTAMAAKFRQQAELKSKENEVSASTESDEKKSDVSSSAAPADPFAKPKPPPDPFSKEKLLAEMSGSGSSGDKESGHRGGPRPPQQRKSEEKKTTTEDFSSGQSLPGQPLIVIQPAPPTNPSDGFINVTAPVPSDADLAGSNVIMSSAAKDDSTKKPNKFSPLVSDGRFLYSMAPKIVDKPDEKRTANTRVHIVVRALDPEAKLENCHTVTLMSAACRPNAVLLFGTSSSSGSKSHRPARRTRVRRMPSASMGMPHPGRGEQQSFSFINLGCPSHLNFDGSITMECFFRISDAAWVNSACHGLFHHGDASYRTFVLVQRNYIQAGCVTRMGTGSVAGSVTADFSEWQHIAATYDSSQNKWSMYLNGYEVISQNSPFGNAQNPADWIIGSSTQYRFCGEIAEARIWKRALSESEVLANIAKPPPVDSDGLVLYMPLDDGFGLTVRDRTSYGLVGTLCSCSWIDSNRPVQVRQSLPVGPYKFSPRVLSEACFYTNGESLAVLYSDALAATAFPGLSSTVFQVFSLETGNMLEEKEHFEARGVLAGCVSPTADRLFLIQEGILIHRYRISAPLTVSKWRQARMNVDEDSSLKFPIRALQELYRLPKTVGDVQINESSGEEERDESEQPVTNNEEEGGSRALLRELNTGTFVTLSDLPLLSEELNFSAVPESKTEDDTARDVVSVSVAVMSIVSRLDADCKHTQQINLLKVPPSLQHLFAVDLSPTTFTNLLELLTSLSANYYRSAPPGSDARLAELRMYVFLILLRLFKINITHLVQWSVDAEFCGFFQQPTSTAASATAVGTVSKSSSAASAPNPVKALRLRERFVQLLNTLITKMPPADAPTSLLISPRIHEEVTEILSRGMSIFFASPLDRISILSTLIREASDADLQRFSPVRSLLTTRLFQSQSQAVNVVPLVSALVTLARFVEDAKTSSKSVQSASATPTKAHLEMAALLDQTVGLLVQNSRSLLEAHFNSAASFPSTSGGVLVDNKPNEDSQALTNALREFIGRVQICLLSSARSSSAKHHISVSYSIRVVELFQELLDWCVRKLDALSPANSATNAYTLLPYVSEILRVSIGAVLQPLLTSLWTLTLEPSTALQMLRPLRLLLMSMDTLASRMPDVQAAERHLLTAQSKRLMVSKTAVAESSHPIQPGYSEKTLTLSGVREMVLEIDPRSFQSPGGNQPSSISLYRKPGMTDLVQTFSAVPSRPVKVNADTVYIVYGSGFGGGWGFKVTGKGFYEEDTLVGNDMPWIHDLCKSLALFASKCTGVIITGIPLKDVEIANSKWLDSELLSEGLEHTAGVDAEEMKEGEAILGNVGQDELQAEKPFFARHRSYTGVSITDLVSSLPSLMQAARIDAGVFPVPREVAGLVHEAILAVIAVLVKHNKLTALLQSYVSSALAGNKIAPPYPLVRVYKTAHKLRQWLVQSFQNKVSKTKESKPDQKQDAEELDADTKEDEDTILEEKPISEDLEQLEAAMSESAAQSLRIQIYGQMHREVLACCRFLMDVLPAPSPDDNDDSDAPSGPKLRRARSGAGDQDSMTEDEKKAHATMLAWQSTRDTVKLRNASPDDRFTLLWRLVLHFLDDNVSLDSLQQALKIRRHRARLRTHGLQLLKRLFDGVSLSSVKRELLACLMPALSSSDRAAMSGVAADIMLRLRPCGEKLKEQVRGAMEELYSSLVGVLLKPRQSGFQLLQAALHAFSLKYSEDDFKLALSLGIFPALHKILLSDEHELSGDQSSSSTSSSDIKEKEYKEPLLGFETATVVSSESVQAPFKTSAWALLDLLTTVLGSINASAKDRRMDEHQPIFNILLSQLDKMASNLRLQHNRDIRVKSSLTGTQVGDDEVLVDGFVPQLPTSSVATLNLTSGDSSGSSFESRMARKTGGTTTFGIHATAAEVTDTGDFVVQEELYSDSFNIRVLHLVDNVVRMEAGCRRVATKEGLQSLISVVLLGSPRAQVVALRVIQAILLSLKSSSGVEQPLTLALMDQCVLGALQQSGTLAADFLSAARVYSSKEAGCVTINFLIRDIGLRVAAPSFTSAACDTGVMASKNVRSIIHRLGLFRYRSVDGVNSWAEEVAMLRVLARDAPQWSTVVNNCVRDALASLPTLLQQLQSFIASYVKGSTVQSQLDQQLILSVPLWEQLWICVGALCVFGGYVESLRVGSRVHLLSLHDNGTILSRNLSAGTVSVLRDGESKIIEDKVANVISLNSVPFDISSFNGVKPAQVLSVLAGVLVDLQAIRLGFSSPSESDAVKTVSKVKKRQLVPPTVLEMNVAGVTVSMLHAHCSRALHSLLLHDSYVELFLRQQPAFVALFALANQSSPLTEKQRLTTSALEDRIQALTLELARRARSTAAISVTIRNEQPRLRLHRPTAEFEAEYAALGGRCDPTNSVSGSLVYIRLNEEPTREKCAGKVVLLDSYGALKERLRLVNDCGAVGVVLALHSESAKLENLHDKSEEDTDSKDEKGEGLPDVLAEAKEAVLRTAESTRALAWSTGPSFPDAHSVELKASYPRAGYGGFAAAAATAPRSRRAAAAAAAAVSEEKSDEPEVERVAKNLPLIAVPAQTGIALRTVLGVRDEDNPEQLNKDMLSAQLAARGYPAEHVLRALEKNDFDVEQAAKWIDQNKEWLLDTENEDLIEETKPDSKATTNSLAVPRPNVTIEHNIDMHSEYSDDGYYTDEYDMPYPTSHLPPPVLTGPPPSALVPDASGPVSDELKLLEATWARFARDNPDSDTLRSFVNLSQRLNTCDAGWLNELASRPTHSLLTELVRSHHFATIQYARRALSSIFLRFPRSQDWGRLSAVFNATGAPDHKKTLHKILAVALSLEAFPACELQPEHHLKNSELKPRLLKAILKQQRNQSSAAQHVGAAMLDSALLILNSVITESFSDESETQVKTMALEITSNMGVGAPAQELHVPEFSALRLSFSADAMPLRSGYHLHVSLYSDPGCTALIRHIEVNRYSASEEVIVPTNTVYYQAFSPNWYRNAPPLSIGVTIKNIALQINTSDADALAGGVETALSFIDLAMRAGCLVPIKVPLLLLRSLSRTRDSFAAQRNCRMAIRLFNNMECLADSLEPVLVTEDHKDSEKEIALNEVRSEIMQWVRNLEKVHSALRSSVLLNWNGTDAPGPHLQNLLELVLAARKAVRADEREALADQSVGTGSAIKAPQYMLDAYRLYRDGQTKVSCIHIPERRLVHNNVLMYSDSSGQADIFVADVALRGGGKWYFEVTLKNAPSHLSMGFITREYRMSRQDIGFDRTGHSWAISGPQTRFVHRGASRNVARDGSAQDNENFSMPTWHANVVVGVMLDLDEREMQFTFSGKSCGVAFSGLDPNEGYYPAISLGRNSHVTVNFGREPMSHFPGGPLKAVYAAPAPADASAKPSPFGFSVEPANFGAIPLETREALGYTLPTDSRDSRAAAPVPVTAITKGGKNSAEKPRRNKRGQAKKNAAAAASSTSATAGGRNDKASAKPQASTGAANQPTPKTSQTTAAQSNPFTQTQSNSSTPSATSVWARSSSTPQNSFSLSAPSTQVNINSASSFAQFQQIPQNVAVSFGDSASFELPRLSPSSATALLGASPAMTISHWQTAAASPGGPAARSSPVSNPAIPLPSQAIKASLSRDASAPDNADAEPKSGWCSLEHPQITTSSWLARYRLASDVTAMLYQRTALPPVVVTSALESEVSLSPTEMSFEVFDTDSTDVTGGMCVPENVLVDSSLVFQTNRANNVHMCFNAVGKDADFILQEVSIRCQNGSCQGLTGMVFISQQEPDLDSFVWCDNWNLSRYQQFVDRKRSSHQAWRSHEPVAFFASSSSSVRVKLDSPRRGRFVTIKLSGKGAPVLFIEFVNFVCIHGSHPLGKLLGSHTPQQMVEAKTREMKDELIKACLAVARDPNWSLQMDEDLVSMVQTLCGKLGVAVRSLDAIMLIAGADERMRFKRLESVPVEILRGRFALLKYLNRLVTPLLHYVDIRLFEKKSLRTSTRAAALPAPGSSSILSAPIPSTDDDDDEEFDEDKFDERSLSYIVHRLKGLYFMSTKKSVFEAMLSMGSQSASAPDGSPGFVSTPSTQHKLTINRFKAARSKEDPASDPDGLNCVFGQSFVQLRNIAFESLRGKKNQQTFFVQFVGEGSIDVGGPYRECLTQMCADLMSETTPLFIPCPNRKNNVGLNREKFCVNPSAKSSLHMAMYEFVGALIGMALRTSASLNLDLPSLVWKQLLNGEAEGLDRSDLEAIDKLCVQALDELSHLTQAKFDYLVMESFTTQLSDGKVAELKPGGKNIPVNYDNRDEFVNLSIEKRLTECSQQVRAMRKGLNAVVPANMLSLFSWYDLELMVCGNPVIDLKMLRKHTQYQGVSSSSALVKNLWRALESFNQEERQLFLRFVWGRSRLPISEDDWTHEFTVHGLRAGDDKLPIAHTCFFSLELPNYTSYETLRKKLLFSILNCQAIDADFNPNSSSLSAWVES